MDSDSVDEIYEPEPSYELRCISCERWLKDDEWAVCDACEKRKTLAKVGVL